MSIFKKRVFDVVSGIIRNDSRVLVCQRMKNDQFGSLWEFPGGKVEKNENRVEALKRELREELGVEIKVCDFINIFEDEIPDMKIRIYLYSCSIVNGVPQCKECQDIKWVTPRGLKKLNLAPADKKIATYISKIF